MPKASDRMAFVDITPKGSSRTYARIGKGFDMSRPQSKSTLLTTQWLDDEFATTSILSKAVSRQISGRRIVGDPFNDYFVSLFNKSGSDCETTIVIVDSWDRVSTSSNVYRAKRYNVTIDCTNDGGGSVADGLRIEGVIYFNGNPVEGYFNLDTKVFTESTGEGA